MWRETGFCLQDSNLGGAESTGAQSPALPETQHFPCSLKGTSPYPALRPRHKQSSSPSGKYTRGPRSRHRLATSRAFRLWSRLSSASMISPGNHLPVALDSGEIWKSHKSQESSLSLCPKSQETRKSGSMRQQVSVLQSRVLGGFSVS